MMNKIAHIFSWVFSPVLIPTYAIFMVLWVSVLAILPVPVRWNVVAMIWLLTCIIPVVAIIVLYKMKIISHPGLNNRNERYIPYIITTLCYLAGAWYLMRIHAPHWVYMFLVGGAGAAALSLVINRWWKISAHGAAIGGLLALAFRIMTDGMGIIDMWPVITAAILCTGFLGTSRILLHCHTFWQVMAGIANGFLWVYILT